MRKMKFAAVLLALAAGAAGTERLVAGSPAEAAPSAVLALQQQPAVAEPTPAPPLTAPPPQSAPPPVSSAVQALRHDLTEILARSTTGAQLGVMAVSLDRGDTLFSHNPDVPLAPASNMKVYSTAAALYYLGPEFRYSTYVLGSGALAGGVLDGDLILYGTGDPSISGRLLPGSVTPLRALADTLIARGVREVRGDVVGDGSYFDAEWLGRGWNPDNFGLSYSAPVGALSIAENVVSIRVQPGESVGAPGRITTTPATRGLAVINETVTRAGGQTVIRFQHAPEGLIIRGQIARGHPGIARSTAVFDPVNFTAAVFRAVLEEQGIVVRGGVRTIQAAEESPVGFARHAARNGDSQQHPRVLAVHMSPPLTDLISVTNHVSQNLFAEALLKTVGRVALGEGTFDAGSRAIRYFLECEAGADSTALAIVDGSGLSPLNRVTARKTIELLDVMTRNEHWEAFYTSLPEAGRPRPRGLMRMTGSPAVGNLRAKTGTIHTVSALSGYVRSRDGEMIAFSILANGLPRSTWLAKRIEDQIGVRLAEFRRGEAAPFQVAEAGRRDGEAQGTAPAATAAPAPTQPAAQQQAQPRQQAAAARTHRVRPGDTLDGIARRNGTTVSAIERMNPGLNPRRIQPGQTIRLP